MLVGAVVKLVVSAFFLMPSSCTPPCRCSPRPRSRWSCARAHRGGVHPGLQGLGRAGRRLRRLRRGAHAAHRLHGFGLVVARSRGGEDHRAMSATEIWSRYVRYIGAGAVAMAGIITVAKALPTMASAFTAVTKGMRAAPGAARTRAAPRRPFRDRPGPPRELRAGLHRGRGADRGPGARRLRGRMGPLARAIAARASASSA